MILLITLGINLAFSSQIVNKKPNQPIINMKINKALLVGAAIAGITGIASATPTLYVSTTGLAGSYTAVDTSASGVLVYSGTTGVWSFVVAVGTTPPASGTLAHPSMDIDISAGSSAAGSLYVALADTGYTGTGGIDAVITGHVVNGAAESYLFDTFASTSDTQPTTTLPTGTIITTLSGLLPVSASANGVLPGSSPYTLGEVLEISSTGATQTSVDASFTSVPDGGMTIAMLGLGLIALEAVRRKLVVA
jgi:VPDSG-CTERM motif